MNASTQTLLSTLLEPLSSVSFASLNMGTLTPMLIVIAGALGILAIDLIKANMDKTLYVMISILVLVIDFIAVMGMSDVISVMGAQRGFFDVMLIDGLAILSQLIIIVASMLFIPLALTGKRFHEFAYPEFFALFLFMIAGFQFMVATDNLILIFVGLETSSLALYTMIAMHNRKKSFEAAIKYFTMGALAAGFYAFGAMVLYAVSGSVELAVIGEKISQAGVENIYMYLLVASAFMLGAFGLKLSLVPFHTWTPDVYEGSSAALAGYMSIVPKIAGFVVAMRLFELLTQSGVIWLDYVLFTVVVVTLTAANIWALVQTDVKRMLAYSSISHAGFVMAAIYLGTTQANSALFLYWILFIFTNLGAFTMLWVSRQKKVAETSEDHPFSKFSGMIKTTPIAAVSMAIFMLSLAGVPPFALFWGKIYMIGSAIQANELALALIMAINSAIAAYYYLKLILYMFFKEPVNDGSVYMINSSTSLKSIIGFALFMTIIAIMYVDPVLQFVTDAVQASGY
ncbi:MAG: NADH-quinone oxidoreductase subunit N [Sulfuricurvum sp. PC08-66]|nr:MAG: NADH-quinone oxidoreductase subunit N [Sulfuricurvum sp. PC08-66]